MWNEGESRLLCELRKSGFKCNTNHVYMDALSYEDDITNSCRSIHG